jgi:hypothetical protein
MEWYQDPMSEDIRRALQNCIKFHGPIENNPSLLNSAIKRIYGVIKADRKGFYEKKTKER